ncbi:MAG: hypothetical protein E6P95_00925 [Candidatus Moraniibacteriota bacterium]|nr:MAG: hypothetical protein E6P95_00925 [Candidatus Moranbacteria bacterium]
MRFPKEFHGQTEWVGFPLKRGLSLEFKVTYVGGVNDYRKVDVTLQASGQLIVLQGRASMINVRDLQGWNTWARDTMVRQTKAVSQQFRRFRLTTKGSGFTLEAYFGDRDPADLIWVYEPESGQPDWAELCDNDTLCVQPTPICEVEPFKAVIEVAVV